MRIRTLLVLSTGGVLGAAAMYLMDPDHAERRRRQGLAQAGRRARRTAASGVRRSMIAVRDVLAAGVAGYREPSTPD